MGKGVRNLATRRNQAWNEPGFFMSPTGIEPAHSVPETDALSTELRGLQEE